MYKAIVGAIVALVILFAVGFGLRYFGVWSDRVIFENSYQKHQSELQEEKNIGAELAKIEHRLQNENLDEDTRNALEAQKRGLEFQLEADR